MTQIPASTQPPFIRISSIVVGHWICALSEEILRQEAMSRDLGPNDDWPDDYDPNDLAMYRSVREWLSRAGVDGTVISEVSRKPIKFAVGVLVGYVRERQSCISKDDLAQLFRAYAEYVALCCALELPKEFEQLTSTGSAMPKYLLSILEFPRSESEQ